MERRSTPAQTGFATTAPGLTCYACEPTGKPEEDRGKTRFTVIYDKQHLNAHIHSAQLRVPEKMGRLAIRIEPGEPAQPNTTYTLRPDRIGTGPLGRVHGPDHDDQGRADSRTLEVAVIQ